MSKSTVRKGDADTGHGAYPPRSNSGGSDDVFINGLAAHRKGDAWPAHCKMVKPYDCHGATTSSGSDSVYVNNQPLARVGDSVSCGSAIAMGSENVFSG